MAGENRKQVKAQEKSAREFLQKASPEQLVEAARQTALAANPLVAKFSPAKEPELRRLVLKEMKDHPDARGQIVRHLTRVGLLAAPAKAPAGEEAPKPKKEKGEKGEKPEKGEKGDKAKGKPEKGEKADKGEKPAS
jgi:hypothetical protein